MCIIVFDVNYRPVFSESLLGFGVFSGESMDSVHRRAVHTEVHIETATTYNLSALRNKAF